jgi:DNA polymerase-3 subunit delta'
MVTASSASGFDTALRGHLSQRQRLLERIQAGRLPGSILLAGPEGVGKRRVALELAQRELCFKRTACGVCDGCRLFKGEPLPVELPNLLRIAPEGKAGMIRIGAIREDDLVEGGVIRWAHQAPPPRCHRWIVVEDAHRLHGASANMLLKTLEEPPPGTHFILVTHRPDSVIQTIRSRCERLAFSPLKEDEVWEIARENGWEPAVRERWCALSGGTLRYLDPGAFERAETQIEAWLKVGACSPFGEPGTEVLLPDKTSDRSQNEQMAETLELLLAVLTDAARLREGHPPSLSPWREKLEVVAGRDLDLGNAQRKILELLRNLIRNPNSELVLRDVALLFAG